MSAPSYRERKRAHDPGRKTSSSTYQSGRRARPSRSRSIIHRAQIQKPMFSLRGASPLRCSANSWPNARLVSPRVYSAQPTLAGTCRVQLKGSRSRFGDVRW